MKKMSLRWKIRLTDQYTRVYTSTHSSAPTASPTPLGVDEGDFKVQIVTAPLFFTLFDPRARLWFPKGSVCLEQMYGSKRPETVLRFSNSPSSHAW